MPYSISKNDSLQYLVAEGICIIKYSEKETFFTKEKQCRCMLYIRKWLIIVLL